MIQNKTTRLNKKSDTRLTDTVNLTKVEIVRQGITGLVVERLVDPKKPN